MQSLVPIFATRSACEELLVRRSMRSEHERSAEKLKVAERIKLIIDLRQIDSKEGRFFVHQKPGKKRNRAKVNVNFVYVLVNKVLLFF